MAQVQTSEPPDPGRSSDEEVDYNKDFIVERKDGSHYCNLCKAYATPAHLKSERHRKREAWNSPCDPANPGDDGVDYSKSFIVDKDGDYFCTLCSNYATLAHMKSEKHLKREAWEQEKLNPPEHCPKEQPKCSDAAPEDAVDYNKPFIVMKDDCYYCTLCKSYATKEHMASEKHLKRAEWEEQPMEQPKCSDAAPKDAVDYNKYFIVTKEECPFCTLCNSYATIAHMTSEKHLKREEWGSADCDHDSEYSKPYVEWRSEPMYAGWYCTLCSQWADIGHLQGKKHLKQAEWYEHEEAATKAAAATRGKDTSSAATSKFRKEDWEEIWSAKDKQYYYHHKASGKVQWEDPFVTIEPTTPWRKLWSEEHRTYYYHNRETNLTTWEVPQGLGEGANRARWNPTDTGRPATGMSEAERWLTGGGVTSALDTEVVT
mmetsp:Transcript_18935/g.42407  ORF Transcript_18935/g.42407 Transcript_18935/m.42407 type:complete len:430 (+) Transcript_18935:97-1386(+)